MCRTSEKRGDEARLSQANCGPYTPTNPRVDGAYMDVYAYTTYESAQLDGVERLRDGALGPPLSRRGADRRRACPAARESACGTDRV